MKKTLLSFFAASLFFVTASFGQCTPNPAYASSPFGLYPDTIPFVQACVGCDASTRVVDFKTFTDTLITGIPVINEVTIHIDAFKITGVSGIPSGLTFGSNVPAEADAPYGVWLNGGETPTQTAVQGCVYINGSGDDWNSLLGGGPNNDGKYPIVLNVDARIGQTVPDASLFVANGDWLSTVDPGLGGGEIVIDTYFLDVRLGSLGIRDMDPTQFAILDNYPNPFSGLTTIQFNAPTAMNNLQFSVYSILGKEVHTRTVTAKNGLNNFDFDASALPSGMYIYTLSNGNSVSTRKMTVK